MLSSSPLPTKPNKKRRRHDENTPQPKSRRQKVAMRALSTERSPPSKQKLMAIESNVSETHDTDLVKVISKEGKITRCVDLSARCKHLFVSNN